MNTPLWPLVDLHCHIEGAAPAELIRELAARNGVRLPDHIFDENGHYRWTNFQHFLGAYDAACAAIRTPQDYYDLTYRYYRAAAAVGLIYGEVFISADHGANGGIDYPDMVQAMAEGLGKAREESGVQGRFILTAIRHYGIEKCEATARQAHRHPHKLVTGFGMAGDETTGHPADYTRAFDIARDAELGLTVHAGEVCGALSVRNALEALRPSRIGHGVQAVTDDDLLRRLAGEGVVLEVCPGSNIKVGVYDEYGQSPIRHLRDAGVKLALGSDDPPYFHTDIANEYAQVQRAFDFSDDDMRTISHTGIEAAFCDDQTKADLLARLSP
ncbi:MAG: adenosine deaminase [Robiginitomaculum sp.]|nr:adenosine deaminase [Robiginitomaculum sp.]MDQ7078641.1 adenosine deaminase [Robiginitomaculum sp.]